MTAWFYANGNDRIGPLDFQALQRSVMAGEVRGDSLVWTEAFGSQWRRADSVDALAGALRQSPPPLPDEAAAPSSGGPSAAQYWAAWMVALALSALLGVGNFILSGLASEGTFAAGVAMHYIGTLVSACAAVFIFEAVFRRVRMQAVWKASGWIGLASLALSAINTAATLLTGEASGLRPHELNFVFFTSAAPLLFWALVWANLWRMARNGRIYPSASCPSPKTPPKDSPATRVRWLIISLVALCAVYARLFFAAGS